VIAGEGILSGTRVVDVDVLDVAPTLAYLLGLPIARDLPGRVVEEAFEADWLADHPRLMVPSWSEADLERLLAIGIPNGRTALD
jgi:hypothetical protein